MTEKGLFAVVMVGIGLVVVMALLLARCESRRYGLVDVPEGGCVAVEMTGPYQCDVVVK